MSKSNARPSKISDFCLYVMSWKKTIKPFKKKRPESLSLFPLIVLSEVQSIYQLEMPNERNQIPDHVKISDFNTLLNACTLTRKSKALPLPKDKLHALYIWHLQKPLLIPYQSKLIFQQILIAKCLWKMGQYLRLIQLELLWRCCPITPLDKAVLLVLVFPLIYLLQTSPS